MPQISTTNSLTDFDLCLALAQTSIDTQMEFAWKAWKRRAKFRDTIDIFKVKQDGQLVDSRYGLSAKIAPLSVGLNVRRQDRPGPGHPAPGIRQGRLLRRDQR